MDAPFIELDADARRDAPSLSRMLGRKDGAYLLRNPRAKTSSLKLAERDATEVLSGAVA